MKFILFLPLILMSVFVLNSCGHRSPQYVHLANEITISTAKKLKQTKNLYLIGTGGGMMDDIKMMAMSFQYFNQVDIEKARELAVFAVEEYLTAINNNTDIRSYLHDYPFTAKNIEIRIWFYNPDRSEVPIDMIEYVSALEGSLRYDLRPENKFEHKTLLEESYEDALKIAQKDKL